VTGTDDVAAQYDLGGTAAPLYIHVQMVAVCMAGVTHAPDEITAVHIAELSE
jgi:hypothetical protein